ncbi:MAG TPA: FAD-dependent monooxygenase [Hyphomicrobiaceae bacterium]|nr:FAD-dependent monooxygenase [Hyphomicrobiaceae bacterium]
MVPAAPCDRCSGCASRDRTTRASTSSPTSAWRTISRPSGAPSSSRAPIRAAPCSFTDDLWRLDYQLRDGEDEAEAVREETIRARIAAILGDIGHAGPWELEWWSIYTANTLLLDDYRAGRVFFIGDSAHIVPIFGVRGLNNGLADAFNIGWKLAYVLAGKAGPGLLGSYTPERRGATLDVFANAGKSTRFMTPPSRGWRLAREAALSLAIRHAFTRPLANPRQMQAYTYAESPLTPFPARDQEFAGGPRSGSLAPDVRLQDGTHFRSRIGDELTILLFADAASLPRHKAQVRASPGAAELAVVTVVLGPDCADAAAILDTDHRIARAYDALDGTVYLLRPDHHIAARWRQLDRCELEAAIAACLGKETP